MNLTEHFTLEELTFSSTAERHGIANAPSEDIITVLRATCEHLESVRELLGHPMHIDSGYRCPELNRAVDGDPASAHLTGHAVDFICPAFGSPEQIVRAIRASAIPFDRCITELNAWVHISFDPHMRRQAETAAKVNGQWVYSLIG